MCDLFTDHGYGIYRIVALRIRKLVLMLLRKQIYEIVLVCSDEKMVQWTVSTAGGTSIS